MILRTVIHLIPSQLLMVGNLVVDFQLLLLQALILQKVFQFIIPIMMYAAMMVLLRVIHIIPGRQLQ